MNKRYKFHIHACLHFSYTHLPTLFIYTLAYTFVVRYLISNNCMVQFSTDSLISSHTNSLTCICIKCYVYIWFLVIVFLGKKVSLMFLLDGLLSLPSEDLPVMLFFKSYLICLLNISEQGKETEIMSLCPPS